MPTVIIPPTDVSPYTGTGDQVLSNTPTLTTPNIGAATGTSVNLSGSGTFGGNLTVSGQIRAPYTADGSPGFSFSPANDIGISSFDGASLRFAVAGTRRFLMSSDSTLYGEGNASSLRLASTGFINLTAGGTNQNITLTPSGTGIVSVSGNLTVAGTTLTVGGAVGIVKSLASADLELQTTTAGTNVKIRPGGGTVATFAESGQTTLAGNLTVSGGRVTCNSTSDIRNFVASGNLSEVGFQWANTGTGAKTYTAWSLANSSGLGANGSWILRNETDGITPISIAPTTGNMTLAGNLTVAGTTLTVGGAVGIVKSLASADLELQTTTAGTNVKIRPGAGTVATFAESGQTTLAGNLTVSGTTSAIGGTHTGSSAVLDIRGNSTSTGGDSQLAICGAGADYVKKLILGYNTTSGYATIQANHAGTGTKELKLNPLGGDVSTGGNLTVSGGTVTSGTGTLTLNSSANTVVLQSAGTTALTLDSSQNATFAKAVTAGAITTTGASSGFVINQRATQANAFQLYSSSGTFGLYSYSISTDVLNITGSGDATFAGNVTVGNGALDKELSINSGALNSYSAAIKYQASGTNYWKVGRGSGTGTANFEFYDYQGSPGTRLTIESSTGNATFAGKILGSGGTAAAPSLSFSGDTDSGFYNAGGNQVALACGGGQIWNTTVNGLSFAVGKDIYLGNAYVAGAPTATGYVTIKDSAGITYKVLVST